MTAPTWLRTIAADADADPPQSAAAATVPRPSCATEPHPFDRWMPRPERIPRPILARVPADHREREPGNDLAMYFAVEDDPRRGVKTNVGRIVPNRYLA